MKKFLVALIALALAAPAFADRGPGHGWSRGGGGGNWSRGGDWGWRGDWVWPALIGGAVMYDLAQPRTVYVPQPVPPVYAPTVAVPPPVQNWYFCPAANAYYPYVSTCPTGWQTVPATPPAASMNTVPGTSRNDSPESPQASSVVPSPDDSGMDSPDAMPEDSQDAPADNEDHW